ncbi:DUF962 domain-containing protein [Leptospira wolffii]|uniref:Uncharacterized protein n=1 Tax=Leptospira wolffii TaxID=409998 RepID=A0A2M9ZA65_9LEPT|nr:Mpo1-like protein [Leptospira wolffii]PJZ65341.1 hypothetical protein CH371_13160 [Leptospira wolffii]TGK64780.1 DUF962 domain-containing protein [Leptospira wolffii]TGK76821.1 DUF962 domain-containing protein [Leptospira wolffii]TGK77327.1 DUF962 domain-containing protein [Leptospira wolffii]TGL26722.1 DUF962 domain-containing protein [Leptospira wolffii]
MRFAKEMAFYSAYHQEKRNVWIHVLGVPTITFTLFLVLSRFEIFRIQGFGITAATIFAALVIVYYFSLDFIFAAATSVVFGSLLALAHYLTASLDSTTAWTVFAVAQLVGWGAQFYGHFIFEKSRPALFDNLFQAIVSAPIFVIADVFFELGYRKEIQEAVRKELAAQGKLKNFSTAH